MPVLSIVDEGHEISATEPLTDYLATLGIAYERWPLSGQINKDSTDEAILAAYADRIEDVKQRGGFTKVDVVNVTAATPNLDSMLSRFSAEHWHDEDEVRFTLYGRGLYHVHPAHGPVVSLEVEPGDMIQIPRATLHWFDLCGEREIKAIRFFQEPAGWTPQYTGSTLEARYQPVCFGEAVIKPQELDSIAWPSIG